jgi:hypothetical protein
MRTKLQLYTVPGQVYYNSTRQLVLKGADGIVFVADSQDFALDANVESLQNLEDNLKRQGVRIREIPIIIQYNKRDLPNVLPVEELNQKINRMNCPSFEGVAVLGKGVFESLTMTCRLVLEAIESGVESRRTVSGPEKMTLPPHAAPRGMRPEKSAEQLESPPPRVEAMATKGFALEKEGPLPKAAPPPPELPRARALRQEKPLVPPVEPPPATKVPVPPLAVRTQPLAAEKSLKPEGEEKTADPLSAAGKMLERKKQELSFKTDRGLAKKTAAAREMVKILSCGHPRVSSPGSVEIPLILEVEGPERNIPLNINLSIKLESLEPKLE